MADKFVYRSSAGLAVFLFAVILVFIYLVSINHNLIWDLSASGENTLDTKTMNVLRSLDFDVDIKVFDKQGQEEAVKAAQILDLYINATTKVKYDIIDPDAHPAMVGGFGVDRYGQAILAGRGRQSRVDKVSEETITSAIIKLKRDRQKSVYFVTGHGERNISGDDKNALGQLCESLRKDDYTVRPLMLLRGSTVPQDADLVAVIDPQKDLFPEEIDMIDTYLKGGGSLLVALEPMTDAGLDVLLDKYGIGLEKGMVLDPFSRMVGAEYTVPVVSTYGDVSALKGFAYATFFPTSRPLSIKDALSEDLEVHWLARTSDQSWSEMDMDGLDEGLNATLDKEDTKGPLYLAVYSRKSLDNELSAHMMAFGDADFLSNTYLMVSGNKDMAMNCINQLLDEGYMITMEDSLPTDRPFILTPSQDRIIFYTPIVVIPSIILLVALHVNRKRKTS